MAPDPPCCNRVAITDEDPPVLTDIERTPYVAGMPNMRPFFQYDTKERISGTIYCKMSEQI